MKSFAITEDIMNVINILEPADRGMAYTAVLEYAINDKLPSADSISPAARAVFEAVRIIIEKKVERRRKAEARKESLAQPVPETVTDVERWKKVRLGISKAKSLSDVVWSVCNHFSDPREQKALIWPEFLKRCPGYEDIEYDDEGNVTMLVKKAS